MQNPKEPAAGQLNGKNPEIDWQAVYKELLPKVYHYFWYRTGDEATAEDLTATTFARAWQRRNRFRKDLGRFSNWVFGIAHKVALEHFRQKEHKVSLDDVDLAAEETHKLLETKQDVEQLAGLLAGLPEREREIISLKYGAELTNRAIAKLTGLSESNVGTILHRVVQKFRTEWEHIS
jgi:RNA polymerase sigma-70 factor (ECF subfamily)